MRTKRLRLLVSGLVLATLATSCTGGSDDGSAPTTGADTKSTSTTGSETSTTRPRPAVEYPGADWEQESPAEAHLDPAKLDEIAGQAEAAASDCFLVVRDGKVVTERYWRTSNPTRAQEVWSATKSYTSTLVGIAQADGDLKITDPAAKYIPEWKGTPSEDVTIQNLLSNDSGREWSLQLDYTDMAIGAKDKTAFAIALDQQEPPGTVWVYNNSAIQTLSAVLKKATGEDASAFAQERLLDPIGMTHSVLKKDASGGSLTFMGLSSTCRDMARYGYLMLNDGNWDGEQIVPAAWVHEATGRSSQKLNAAYGYLWWLNQKGPIVGPLRPSTGQGGGDQADGQLVPGAPEDLFFAIGFGNNLIGVDPGTKTVVVRLGPARAPAGSGTFGPKEAARVFTEAVVQPR